MATHAQPVARTNSSLSPPVMSPTAELPADTFSVQADEWAVHVASAVGSTNTACRDLPAWHALRARTQTDGRGRTGRFWVSDEGGLWLSAVLPCPGERSKWAILPLAIGWAVMDALRELGVADLRLRWPNDVMSGQRKLAGLLVERYRDDAAVAGIGLNVRNAPEAADPTLRGATVRLIDLLPDCGTLDDVAATILRAVRRAHALVRDDRFAEIARELNRHWSPSRQVALTLTGRAEPLTGAFHGIDEHGRLLLGTGSGAILPHDATQVTLLRELS